MADEKESREKIWKIIAACMIITILIISGYNLYPSERKKTTEGQINVIDAVGDTIILDKPANRIVPTFFFEEIFALGAEDNIVGWSRGYWEGRRQSIWDKYLNESGFPVEEIPDVGYIYKGTFDCEKVAELDPDIVILYQRQPEIEEKLSKFGIQSVHVDFHSETETIRSIKILGKVLGKEQRAEELAEFYQEQTNKVYSVLENIKDKEKPKVYVEGGWKEYSTYGNTYMFGALVDLAGGENIATSAGIIKSGTISPEYILSEDPDVIIITGATWAGHEDRPQLGYYTDPQKARQSLENRLDRPGWENLTAVKNGTVYSIHHGLARHIYDFYCLQYFAKWFYPEEFADLDPEESWREFHERFLPVTYSGTWSISLEE